MLLENSIFLIIKLIKIDVIIKIIVMYRNKSWLKYDLRKTDNSFKEEREALVYPIGISKNVAL